jgi:NAD(P)H-hydrate epimerase
MKRDQVRQVDQTAIEQLGMSGLVLMENAGRGAAEKIAAFCSREVTVCLLCGAGNNGGDGYVIARHLQLLGHSVRIISLVPLEKLSGDADANARIAQRSNLPIHVAEDADSLQRLIVDGECVVDCMLGTGATGEPRGIHGDAVRLANQRSGPRVAIDLPTGLDCDSGQPAETTFRADLTITFVAEKDGFHAAEAKPWIGNVEVVGIGVPKCLLDQFGVGAS